MTWQSLGAVPESNGLAITAEVADRLASEDAAWRAWLDLRCAEERVRNGRRGRGQRTRQAGREGP